MAGNDKTVFMEELDERTLSGSNLKESTLRIDLTPGECAMGLYISSEKGEKFYKVWKQDGGR